MLDTPHQRWRRIILTTCYNHNLDLIGSISPLPTLLVNLVTLSERPNTVFFTKLAAPWGTVRASKKGNRKLYLGNTDAQFFIPMHDNTVIWGVKDICDPRANVREQANWISYEISRAQDAIELPQHILSVVIRNACLQFR